MQSTQSSWWKSSVAYQIYPRSFADSNGDGVGDLPGITQRLDHLVALGVDVVWLSPVYASPNDDNGYDISDYRAIMPEFGTMADFDAMLAAMHERGLKLVMDLVVNHTSDEHAWFVQARSSRSNPFHDYYIWREPGPDGGPPTNWEAAFSGSAWAWNEATGEYYLHMFSPRQPDLNWENPEVRRQVWDLMHFWLRKGIDGFRMDVINMISKPFEADGRLPDAPRTRAQDPQPAFSMVTHGPRLLEYLAEMKREVLSHYDCLTVGEAPMATVVQGQAITDEAQGSLNMLFQFEHMDLDAIPGDPRGKWALRPLDLRDLKQTMHRWQEGLHGRGWNSLYWCNHDQPRIVSRFGDDGVWRVRSAKALATALHGLQGTPFIYQGEELGLTNQGFESIDECRDIESLNAFRDAVERRGEDPAAMMVAIRTKGRDNARIPMVWDASASGGFTSGTPWIGLHRRRQEIHAEQARRDPDSVFHHYRRLIAMRRQWVVWQLGQTQLLWPDHAQIWAYDRVLGAERLRVVCNLSSEAVQVPWPDGFPAGQATLLIDNTESGPHVDGTVLHLQPWQAVVWHGHTA